MSTATIELTVPVRASVAEVFAAATDWETQGRWMLGTRVENATPDLVGVGGRVRAFTGIGPIGFWDTMEITQWDPPHLCRVLHTGALVRGPGEFAVTAGDGGASTFAWREELDLPFGLLGRLGYPLVAPAFLFGLRLSLRRFARYVESGRAR